MTELSEYLDYSSAPDQLTGGVRRIPITTPKGEFSVWVKRVGNNPRIRLLLLHGGPGATHDTMDPKHMEWMAGQVQHGRYLHCPNGSHLAQYDDPQHFSPGLVKFMRDVHGG